MIFQRKSVVCPIKYNEIPLSTSLEDLTFIVYDTETTGFQVASVDRLIEIGAVTVKGFHVEEQDTYQTYINPNRHISQEITELTSITNKRVESSPEAGEAIADFFDWVEAREAACLIGHYVSFDNLVLKSELKREKLALKNLNTLDTLDLIGVIAPSYDMRDLERYAMAFGTRIYQRHSAVGDALTTAFLFVELLYQCSQRGFKTWGDLLSEVRGVAKGSMR